MVRSEPELQRCVMPGFGDNRIAPRIEVQRIDPQRARRDLRPGAHLLWPTAAVSGDLVRLRPPSERKGRALDQEP